MLFTRAVAIVPTLLVAIFANISKLTGMNDILNVVQSLQLPFALLPVLCFTNTNAIMKQFRNGIITRIVIWFLVISVVGINFYFVVFYLQSSDSTLIYSITAVVTIPYLTLVGYLAYKAIISTLPQKLQEKVEGFVPRLSFCDCPWVTKIPCGWLEKCCNYEPDISWKFWTWGRKKAVSPNTSDELALLTEHSSGDSPVFLRHKTEGAIILTEVSSSEQD